MGVPFGESVPINAWSCCQCHSVHRERSEADACCKCMECGEKFPRQNNYSCVCDRCEYGRNVRHARDAVARAQEDWARNHTRLTNLIDNPPPGKKRPKQPAPPLPPKETVPYVHPDGTVDSSAWAPMYEVRDWLRGLGASLDGQTDMANDCVGMANKLTMGIKATGGGEH
jgi:hypothetical protein